MNARCTPSPATALPLLAITVVLTACTSVGKDRAPSPTMSTSSATTTQSPTPSVDPAVVAAKAAILEAYRGYWAAKVASYANPAQDQDPTLAHFAVDTALTDAQASIASMRKERVRVPGEPVLAPIVSNIDLGSPPGATITDCVDVTDWQAIFTATGSSAVAPGQLLRVVAVATATVYDKRWVIATYTVQRDRTC